MTNQSDSKRLELLEKRVSDLANQVHFQDSMRVQIEKTIGVIDQQLIKQDAKLYKLVGPSKAPAKAKPVVKAKAMAKAKPKSKPKPAPKSKVKAKKKK